MVAHQVDKTEQWDNWTRREDFKALTQAAEIHIPKCPPEVTASRRNIVQL
jgi:hypothetical protein